MTCQHTQLGIQQLRASIDKYQQLSGSFKTARQTERTDLYQPLNRLKRDIEELIFSYDHYHVRLRHQIAKRHDFSFVSNFIGDFAVANGSSMQYVVNRHGNIVFDRQGYDRIWTPDSGTTLAAAKHEQWFILHPDGQEIIIGNLKTAFTEGRALVGGENNFEIINSDGHVVASLPGDVIDLQFIMPGNLIALFFETDNRNGYRLYNLRGQQVGKEYDQIAIPDDDYPYALGWRDDEVFLIDNQGQEVKEIPWPDEEEYSWMSFSSGLMFFTVATEEGSMAGRVIFDLDGNRVSKKIYQENSWYSEGLCPLLTETIHVDPNGRQYPYKHIVFIDTSGNEVLTKIQGMVISHVYHDGGLTGFSEGLAAVVLENEEYFSPFLFNATKKAKLQWTDHLFHYIDQTGKIVIDEAVF